LCHFSEGHTEKKNKKVNININEYKLRRKYHDECEEECQDEDEDEYDGAKGRRRCRFAAYRGDQIEAQRAKAPPLDETRKDLPLRNVLLAILGICLPMFDG
jgi:hypothetical protein